MSLPLLGIVIGAMVALAGLIAVVSVAAGIAPPRAGTSTHSPGHRVRLARRHVLAGVVGLLVFVLTGWLAAGLGTGGAVLLLPTIFTAGAAAKTRIELRAALSSWTRRMSDLLASGAVSSLDEALRRSAESSPALIRPQLQAMVTRMGPQGVEAALHGLAGKLGDEVADQVVMALSLRARHGGAGLATVLHQVAADVDAHVAMERTQQAETGKQVQNVRWIVLFMVVMLAAAMMFARDFLSPYSTAGGQIVLLLIVGVFGAALVWMRRLAMPIPGVRLLGGNPQVRGVKR